MTPKHLQRCIEEKKTSSLEVPPGTVDEKTIALVQICLRCGRKFQFKRGRKRCPRCQGLLRTTTMVIKVSPLFPMENV